MQRLSYTFGAMACENTIELYCVNKRIGDEAAKLAVAEVLRIEAKYSRYRDDSVVTAINRAAGLHAVDVDLETAQLFDYADACFRQSDGLFDITSGVLRQAWNFKLGAMKSVPSAQELQPLLRLIDWPCVERVPSSDGARIKLPVTGMEIDFGGFGKEYAADRAAAVLLGQGIHHGFVNMGGDVVVTGPHVSGEPWLLGIQHPRIPGTVIASLPVRQGAVATSGDYERYVEIGGIRYCHLLNPRTGMPTSVRHTLQSATVFAPTCLVAGSIATIAMLVGEDNGQDNSWLKRSGADYFVVDGRGAGVVSVSPNLRAAMRMTDSTSKSSKQ
jgi:FAD:protein FMN transferase